MAQSALLKWGVIGLGAWLLLRPRPAPAAEWETVEPLPGLPELEPVEWELPPAPEGASDYQRYPDRFPQRYPSRYRQRFPSS